MSDSPVKGEVRVMDHVRLARWVVRVGIGAFASSVVMDTALWFLYKTTVPSIAVAALSGCFALLCAGLLDVLKE